MNSICCNARTWKSRLNKRICTKCKRATWTYPSPIEKIAVWAIMILACLFFWACLATLAWGSTDSLSPLTHSGLPQASNCGCTRESKDSVCIAYYQLKDQGFDVKVTCKKESKYEETN